MLFKPQTCSTQQVSNIADFSNHNSLFFLFVSSFAVVSQGPVFKLVEELEVVLIYMLFVCFFYLINEVTLQFQNMRKLKVLILDYFFLVVRFGIDEFKCE